MDRRIISNSEGVFAILVARYLMCTGPMESTRHLSLWWMIVGQQQLQSLHHHKASFEKLHRQFQSQD